MSKKIITLVNVANNAYKNANIVSEEQILPELRGVWSQRGGTFEKDLNLKGRYCYHPFNTITIDGNGDVFPCICQAWLPISLGKIWEFDSLDDIPRTARAREIQRTILDGSYKYCDNNICGLIASDDLHGRIDHKPDTINWINFAIDSSCNLTCPSCRKEFVFVNEGPAYDLRMMIVKHVTKLIENHGQFLKFSVSGDGDPFASLIYRELLSGLDVNNKDVEIEIITNGILAKAHWHKMAGIHNKVVRFKISFDAATAETYNIVRRGGEWDKVLDSAKYIAVWKQKHYSNMQLTGNFVVQAANYKEMPAYVELLDALGFDEILFQAVHDWGTFSDYSSHAVWRSEHPEYSEFLKCLHDPRLNNKKVNLTNLSDIKYATQ